MPTLLDHRAQRSTPSKFSPDIPDLQFAWDSTSLGLLQECARKYYYQMVLGRHPRGTSIHLSFGIAYHKALEIFDHALADGNDEMESLRTAVDYCVTFEDGSDPDPNKNRMTLTRSVVWYVEQFRNDIYHTVLLDSGKPAVELSFRFGLEIDGPGIDEFLYCGHLDRLMQRDNEYYWGDRKTTKGQLNDQFYAQFTPNTQMSGYFAASQVVLPKPARAGIIDAVQLLVGGSRFGRRPVHRTPGQIDEWIKTTRWWMRQAQRYAEEGFWPMNEKSCNNYGGCSYRPTCGKDPAVRDNFLIADTETWDWNPLIIRGDV